MDRLWTHSMKHYPRIPLWHNFSCQKVYIINDYSYLCNNRIRHASRRTAYQGESFAFMGTLRLYTKQALSKYEYFR